MLTAEEKVEVLHTRMKVRQQKREKRKLSVLCAACTALSLSLFLIIYNCETSHFAGTSGLYSGATMLFGDSGFYVLIALIAFMAGVLMTVLYTRYGKHGLIHRNDMEEQRKRGRK